MLAPSRLCLPAVLLSASLLVLTGCASDLEEQFAATEAALTTFTAAQCDAPAVTTNPLRDPITQQPIDGTARTTLDGCVLARPAESGASMLGRTQTMLGNTARFGTLRRDDGSLVFSRFTPLTPTGSLTSPTGLVQDIDVRLNMDFSPSSRLRVTRRRNADGSYSLTITNITPFRASIAFIPVTVVKTNNLTLDVRLRPESNGIGVRGHSQITLEHEKQQAASASELVHQLFDWLTTELH